MTLEFIDKNKVFPTNIFISIESNATALCDLFFNVEKDNHTKNLYNEFSVFNDILK